jgi:hypothetical protein
MDVECMTKTPSDLQSRAVPKILLDGWAPQRQVRVRYVKTLVSGDVDGVDG